MSMRLAAILLAALSTFAAVPASAFYARITVIGEVEFNQINSGTLGDAVSGDAVEFSFLVDARDFVDSTNFPTRGFIIDPDSFSLSFAGGPSIGLVNPSSPSDTPLFVIRNDDPAVDGFFLGNNVDGFPNGIALDEAGIFEQFRLNFSVTYGDDPLPSLNVLDATGVYDFAGLTVFGMSILDGPFDAMGMVFEQMTIEKVVIPIPAAWLMMLSALAVLTRWRRAPA